MTSLILFTGPPGVGKSTLSYKLAQEKGWAIFTRDQIDRSLEKLHIVNRDAGYEILLGLTKLNLQNNVSVILDATFTIEDARLRVKGIVKDTDVKLYVIVCTCSDLDLWKKRIESRPEAVEGWTPADWEEAQRVHGNYEDWSDPHLVLDSINSFEKNYQKLLTYIQ